MQAIKQNLSFITVLRMILTGCYCELFWFRYLKTVKLYLLIVKLVKLLQIHAVKSSKSFIVTAVSVWN